MKKEQIKKFINDNNVLLSWLERDIGRVFAGDIDAQSLLLTLLNCERFINYYNLTLTIAYNDQYGGGESDGT